MTKIFLDCGLYKAITLRRYVDEGVVDKDWLVYAFEPNPEIDVDEAIASVPSLKVSLIKEAVWIRDETLKLWLGGREDAASLDGTARISGDRMYEVETFDFSDFVEKLPEPSYIICSMDIEGAEFPVLDKMLVDGTASRINKLDIDFHHRLVNEVTQADTEALIKRLNEVGVKISLKVPLN